jgi:acyl-CoA thioesterase I
MIKFARQFGLCCSVAATVASAVQSTAVAAPAVETRRNSGSRTAAGRIVVLGDSLAVSPSRTDNFPAELQKRLHAVGAKWAVVNAGVRGDKTANGLRRFNDALTGQTRILILELGANDGLRGVEVSVVERNLSTMIERAQRQGISVLLCGMIVPPRYGWDYALAFHQLFQRLATKYKVPLVPFLLDGVALNPDFNGADGIHPNAAGAQRIADTVWPYLESLIKQQTMAIVQPHPAAGYGTNARLSRESTSPGNDRDAAAPVGAVVATIAEKPAGAARSSE